METPKIIHQTWKTHDLSELYSQLSQEWKQMYPDFDYRFYTDDDLRKYVKEYFPEYLDSYDSFSKNIERVDFARYCMMEHDGGVYVDMDTRPLKRFDHLINLNVPVLGVEPPEHDTWDDEMLCNAVMMSPPHHPFWRCLLDYIIDNYEEGMNPVENTGPAAMHQMRIRHPEVYKGVVILGPCEFYPLTNGKTDKTQGEYKHVSSVCNIKDSYVAHLWSNEWVSKGWFSSPRWGNKRYWFSGLCFAFAVLLFFVTVF
jgi:hypothetical protein